MALGRASAKFNPTTGWDNLKRAETTCRRLSDTDSAAATLRRIQLSRSQCVLLAESGRGNRREIEHLGEECIPTAKACGYDRYAAEIEERLRKL